MRRAALALALTLLAPLAARADGAFPTGMSVFVPAALPHRILVGTTFGLVISEDDGGSWRYVCEPHVTGSLNTVLVYQAGSNGDVVAAHQDNLSSSTDLCTWTRATGPMSGLIVVDAFVSPANPDSVLAIGWPVANGASLFPSSDGGRSFGAPLLESGSPAVRSDERLLSVEIATSSASVVYATTSATSPPFGSALLRSLDGGATWTRSELDVDPSAQVKIAQIDPSDANTVYLLVSVGGRDSIAATSDAGASLQTLLATETTLGGFVRASDGTLYSGSMAGDFYVRPAGSTQFERLRGPRLQCLGERAGRVYVCGVGTLDQYDVAISDDRGKSFQKLLSFSEIGGPLSCPAVQSACAADFEQLQRTLAGPVASCSCGHGAGGIAELLLVVSAIFLRRRGVSRRRTAKRPARSSPARTRRHPTA